MKFRYLFFIIPLAYLLSGCGKSGDVAQAPAPAANNTNTTSGSGVATTDNNNNSNNNSGNTTTTCSRTSSTSGVVGSPFIGTARGSGQSAVFINFNNPQYNGGIKADQDLRFTVTPTGSETSTQNGNLQAIDQAVALGIVASATVANNQPYQQMAVTINLVQDGTVLDGTNGTVDTTTQIPAQTGRGYFGPTAGIPTGRPSSIIDFSSYLSPGHVYQFQASKVMTDYTCQSACNTLFASQSCAAAEGVFWQYQDPSCALNYVTQCVQMNCDVFAASDNSSWSLKIAVETDVTTCVSK